MKIKAIFNKLSYVTIIAITQFHEYTYIYYINGLGEIRYSQDLMDFSINTKQFEVE